jgi:hypothetical protein
MGTTRRDHQLQGMSSAYWGAKGSFVCVPACGVTGSCAGRVAGCRYEKTEIPE